MQNKRNELLTSTLKNQTTFVAFMINHLYVELEAQQPSKLKPSHKKSKGGMMMDVETAETATSTARCN